jgi:hypothetical protein
MMIASPFDRRLMLEAREKEKKAAEKEMRESIQLSSEELLQHADFMYTQYNWTV